jgi:hypothetical protein
MTKNWPTYFGTVSNGRGENLEITYTTPPVISREVALSLCREVVRKGGRCETHEGEVGRKTKRHDLPPRTSLTRKASYEKIR